jgi:hypothetical protein
LTVIRCSHVPSRELPANAGIALNAETKASCTASAASVSPSNHRATTIIAPERTRKSTS